MKKTLVIAAALAVLSVPALAQNSPFNSSGTQAGGPLAGQQRAAGAPGGQPASQGMAPGAGGETMAPAPTRKRMMTKKRMSRKMMKGRRHAM